MTEEIKEILHLLKRCDNTYLKIENSNGEKEYEYHQVNDLRLDGYHSQLLLDYITNLQQENERLKDWNKKLIRDDLEYVNKSFEQNNYKSRCEKANKFIKQTPLFEDPFGEGEHAFLEDVNTEYYKNLSNILNGSDENEY